MPDFQIEDFDPNYDMLGAANWLIRAADYADHVLADHPEKVEFCEELHLGAVAFAELHGRIAGSIEAIQRFAVHLRDAQARIDDFRQKYTESRTKFINIICHRYLKAVVMARDVNSRPGRPRKRLPDYDALESMTDSDSISKFAQYAWEFDIAVTLAKNKKLTGEFTGLVRLLDEAVEAGHIDDIGDTSQRIKRLAQQIYEDEPLYLSPGLREARTTALGFIYSGE